MQTILDELTRKPIIAIRAIAQRAITSSTGQTTNRCVRASTASYLLSNHFSAIQIADEPLAGEEADRKRSLVRRPWSGIPSRRRQRQRDSRVRHVLLRKQCCNRYVRIALDPQKPGRYLSCPRQKVFSFTEPILGITRSFVPGTRSGARWQQRLHRRLRNVLASHG
jgi:hypothetical protein